MRELLYVPVIHVDSDMGSIASDVDKRSAGICGEERWERHKRNVTIFWDKIEEYFKKPDAGNLKIYQDGLLADGELGQKIIEEGARKGSRNFRIILDLIERGGEIRKTEDVALLKEEYNRILKLAQTKSLWERTTAYIGYRIHKDKMMEKRDRFIAKTINETLKEEERGILFMGAFHDVPQYLAGDIDVKEIKRIERVRTYFKELMSGKNRVKFDQSTEYLIADVVDSGQQPMTNEGQYIYAIVATDEEKSFGPIGIGDRKDEVYTVCYRDIGAVISSSPIVKYSVTRANTMAHQNVMEEVMKQYPMLPVRFGTIGEGIELIKDKVLNARYNELKGLLKYVEDKIELGLKVLWLNKENVFKEIVDENKDIRMLRDHLMSRKVRPQRDQVRLGDMVKKALETKKMKEEKAILDLLKGFWVEHKKNDVFGDQMVTNSAFLIRKDGEKAFDEMVDKITAGHDGKMKFKYVGPVPPCNFVEIVVKW